VKDRDPVALTDLPCFGRQAVLVWLKRRWRCSSVECPVGSWTETAPAIAAPRLRLTDRAGRWATLQVGFHGRAVAEVAADLGADWHTVNDAVIAYGSLLVDDPARIGEVEALGLDEVLFARRGPPQAQGVVDVDRGRRHRVGCWMSWRAAIRRRCAPGCESRSWLVWPDRLRDAGSVRALPGGVRHDAAGCGPGRRSVPRREAGGHKLDEVRRRVQNETLGHRGRKTDPLYRARKLLLLAKQRLDDDSNAKLTWSADRG
jgi:transposase